MESNFVAMVGDDVTPIMGPTGDSDRQKPRTKIEYFSLVVHFLLFVCSALEFGLAITWMHVWGIIMGIIGILIAVGGFIAWRQRWLRRRKTKLMLYFIRPLYFLVRAFLLFLLIIQIIGHLDAPDPNWTTFPLGCRDFRDDDNCTRVALNSTRADGLVPPHLNTTLPHAHALIRSWILRGGVQSTILFSNEQFIHASDNSTVVYTQSQARLGTGDFDVNLDRVRDFINYLNDLRLNNGKCVGFM